MKQEGEVPERWIGPSCFLHPCPHLLAYFGRDDVDGVIVTARRRGASGLSARMGARIGRLGTKQLEHETDETGKHDHQTGKERDTDGHEGDQRGNDEA